MKPLFFPVEAHTGGYRPTPHCVAVFFDSSSAIDFISTEHPRRSLYLGEPKSDRRESGYRFSDGRDWRAEYEAWAAQFTQVRGDPMKARAAA